MASSYSTSLLLWFKHSKTYCSCGSNISDNSHTHTEGGGGGVNGVKETLSLRYTERRRRRGREGKQRKTKE